MIIDNLILDNELYNRRTLGMNIAAGSVSANLDKEKAVELINHLIEVFEMCPSDYE